MFVAGNSTPIKQIKRKNNGYKISFGLVHPQVVSRGKRRAGICKPQVGVAEGRGWDLLHRPAANVEQPKNGNPFRVFGAVRG